MKKIKFGMLLLSLFVCVSCSPDNNGTNDNPPPDPAPQQQIVESGDLPFIP